MTIDVESVAGAKIPEFTTSWTADDVILYQLGLGAGDRPTDPGELAYVYEDGLKVLPSYAVLPAMGSLLGMLALPGMDVELAQMLHGEQELELHEPLPAAAEVRTAARITGVYDKGKAALVVIEAVSSAVDDDRPLFTNRFGAFVRGAGGFGESGGPPARDTRPDRAPDHVVACPTLPQQALIYRLSGDRNPLHADPAVAARAGFDQPILHGLCSYGIVCKAVVDSVLGGDVTRVAGYNARFAGVVFPGETIEVSAWEAGDRITVAARALERDAPVLANAAILTR
jgi:acyl dehydratase